MLVNRYRKAALVPVPDVAEISCAVSIAGNSMQRFAHNLRSLLCSAAGHRTRAIPKTVRAGSGTLIKDATPYHYHHPPRRFFPNRWPIGFYPFQPVGNRVRGETPAGSATRSAGANPSLAILPIGGCLGGGTNVRPAYCDLDLRHLLRRCSSGGVCSANRSSAGVRRLSSDFHGSRLESRQTEDRVPSHYTLPYVMVSYYIRYVVALDVVMIQFCLWG